MSTEPTIKIVKAGDPLLKQIASLVTSEEYRKGNVIEIVEALNIVARDLKAVGFAAPQLGYSKRIFTLGMEFENPRRPNVKQFPRMIFINPEISYFSEEQAEDWEGCASFDSMLAYVRRPITIHYKAQDISGKSLEGELTGFPARVFQHEMDHLNGVLMDSKAIETKVFDRERDIIISYQS